MGYAVVQFPKPMMSRGVPVGDFGFGNWVGMGSLMGRDDQQRRATKGATRQNRLRTSGRRHKSRARIAYCQSPAKAPGANNFNSAPKIMRPSSRARPISICAAPRDTPRPLSPLRISVAVTPSGCRAKIMSITDCMSLTSVTPAAESARRSGAGWPNIAGKSSSQTMCEQRMQKWLGSPKSSWSARHS